MLRSRLRSRWASSSAAASSWSAIESRCLRALQGVIHPETRRDLVYSGLIHRIEQRPGGAVLVHLDVDRHYRALRAAIANALRSVASVSEVEVRMAPIAANSSRESHSGAPLQAEATAGRRAGLSDVDRIVSVSSCKGGVGKSTVAVNLAFALAQAGLRVGLLDADLFGPSLPTQIGAVGQRLHRDAAHRVVPLIRDGVRCVSYGFMAPDPGAATVLRGPVASQIVQQLVLGTSWGQLDYLVVDTPPGTGDIPLSLLQAMSLSANVVVTTPQLLSHIDVVKGLAMFKKLDVPTVAAVNNMAYFVCDRCETRHYPFGCQTHDYMADFQIPICTDIPINSQVGADIDSGVPAILSNNPRTEPLREQIRSLAAALHDHLQVLPSNLASTRPQVAVNANGDITFTEQEHCSSIDAELLRQRCQCAACLENGTDSSSRRRAVKILSVGNYGVEVAWDDGHRGSIYSFDNLRTLSSSPNTQPRKSDRI